MWSVDRLHPGERGHRLLAVGAHDALAGRGLAVGGRPELEPTGWTSTCSARSRP